MVLQRCIIKVLLTQTNDHRYFPDGEMDQLIYTRGFALSKSWKYHWLGWKDDGVENGSWDLEGNMKEMN